MINFCIKILKHFDVKGMAHITGGGLTGNIPRILPRGLSVKIKKNSWPTPHIFNFISKNGGVPIKEMYQVFNMGIGLVIIVSADQSDRLVQYLSRFQEKAFVIGEVISYQKPGRVVYA